MSQKTLNCYILNHHNLNSQHSNVNNIYLSTSHDAIESIAFNILLEDGYCILLQNDKYMILEDRPVILFEDSETRMIKEDETYIILEK